MRGFVRIVPLDDGDGPHDLLLDCCDHVDGLRVDSLRMVNGDWNGIEEMFVHCSIHRVGFPNERFSVATLSSGILGDISVPGGVGSCCTASVDLHVGQRDGGLVLRFDVACGQLASGWNVEVFGVAEFSMERAIRRASIE